MENEYKLLKWYPSLPKGWKVGEIVKQSYCPNGYSSTRFDYRTYIPNHEVENNPEFWEKIEPKNYEILSFTTSESILCEKSNNNNMNIFRNTLPEDLSKYLQDCIDEGAKIQTFASEDSICFLWEEPSLSDWYIFIQWFEGSDEYNLVNIEGKSLAEIRKIIKEGYV